MANDRSGQRRGRFLVFLLMLLLTLALSLAQTAEAFAATEAPDTQCHGVLLYDQKTGEVLYEKNADEAMTLLECYPNRGARMLEKVLKSAMHNAEDLRAQNVDQLVVAEVRIDEGPMQRRWRAGSRGVSYVIKLRSSHISVVLR